MRGEEGAGRRARGGTHPCLGVRGCCRRRYALRLPAVALSNSLLQIHLFDVDVPGGPVLMESRCVCLWGGGGRGGALGEVCLHTRTHCLSPACPSATDATTTSPSLHHRAHCNLSRFTAPGTQLVACDSPAGRLGISTCYDLRFAELYQRLTFDMGAEVGVAA